MYQVKITFKDGTTMRATVTRESLTSLQLKSCASVSWVKVRS
jgi:hypothetical protein